MRLWRVSDNSCTAVLEGTRFHSDSVSAFDMFSKTQIIVTGGDDRSICISNYNNGKTYKKTQEIGDIQSVAVADKLVNKV